MSMLAPVALVCALLGAPGLPAPTVSGHAAASVLPAPAGVPSPRSVEAEIEALQKAADRAEAAAPDEAARLRVRVNLVTQLLLVLIRQQEQLRLQNEALLSALGSAGPPRPAGATAAPSAGTAAPATGTPAHAGSPATAAGPPPPTGVGAGIARPAGALFGKRGLNKVHRPRCPAGERIALAERVFFASLSQAIAAGYQPCKMCRPDR